VVVVEEEQEEVDNLLDLLYTGTARQTHGLIQLLNSLQVDPGSWKSTAKERISTLNEEEEDFDDPMDNDAELDLPEGQAKSDDDDELVAGDEDWRPASHFRKPRVKKQKDKEWKCSECALIYLSQSDMKNHVRDSHTASRNQEKENSENILDDNDGDNDNNEGGTNTQLDIEELVRKINEDPTLTLKQMNIKLNTTHSCYYCTKTFKKQTKMSTIETHVINHHPDSHKEFLERYESKKPMIRSENLINRIVKHEKGPKGFMCERCDFKSGTIESLKNHIQFHLNKDILCPDCGESCVDGQAFKEHKKKYHRRRTVKKKYVKVKKKRENGDKPPPRVMCEICSNSYSSKVGLRNHIKQIHIGLDKVYECPECGKKSGYLSAHIKHMLKHKPPTIPCPQCDTKVRSNEYLRRHILSHHTAPEDLGFHCDQCGKGFTNERTLEGHMNMHLGLKPYKCRYCSNCYQNYENRLNHEKKSHRDIYKNRVPGLQRQRQRKRDLGEVEVMEEDLLVHRRAEGGGEPDATYVECEVWTQDTEGDYVRAVASITD